MTTSHLDDEQLTALQDGDGPADGRAHLEGCARCRTRADALATVAALVAAPPPAPPDASLEAAVAAALEHADRPVVPLRRAPRRGAPAWLAPAAAVVALLALIAVVVPQLGMGGADDDSGDSGETAAGSAAETTLGESDQRGSRDGAGAESTLQDNAERSAALTGVDLGAVQEADELARRVDDALAAGAATDTARAAAEPACAAAFRAVAPPPGPLRLQASVVWRGEPAAVLSDGERAVVLATDGCAPLITVDLP